MGGARVVEVTDPNALTAVRQINALYASGFSCPNVRGEYKLWIGWQVCSGGETHASSRQRIMSGSSAISGMGSMAKASLAILKV